MRNATKIDKRTWTLHGGLSNPCLFRLQKRGVWHYYKAHK